MGLCADKASVTITTGWRRPCVSSCLRDPLRGYPRRLCVPIPRTGKETFASSTGSEAGIRAEARPRFSGAWLPKELPAGSFRSALPALPALTRALTVMKEPRWGQGLPAVADPENVSLVPFPPPPPLIQLGVWEGGLSLLHYLLNE